MKKLLLALMILASAGAGLFALNHAAAHGRQQLQAEQTAWRTQAEALAQAQAEQAVLTAKLRDLQRQGQASAPAATLDPALADSLLTNNLPPGSPELQEKLLAAFGAGANSSAGYVLVTKAALKASTLRPLKTFPDNEKLTDAVRGVLAITPQEQQSVEAAFADAFAAAATWAKANVQRGGPSGDMLVRYTIPADTNFEQASTEKLFSTVNGILGQERNDLLRGYFQAHRIFEDGAIGDRTNILEIYRVPGQSALRYRAGWKWENAEAINTRPEPIKLARFPAAFSFVFPGGWQEIARREGIELREGPDPKP